jgi:hypothetical protein
MTETKRLYAKPVYPTSVFGGRQGEWPEIGPEWTELTREQLDAAAAEAPLCGVQLKVLEVGSAEELLEQLKEHGEVGPDAPQVGPEVVRVAAPNANASTDEWREYAVNVRGLEVFEGAKRSDIQAIVAKADEPVENEEV